MCKKDVVEEMLMCSDLNRFELHPTKSKELRIEFLKRPRSFNPIKVGNKALEVVKTAQNLGLWMLMMTSNGMPMSILLPLKHPRGYTSLSNWSVPVRKQKIMFILQNLHSSRDWLFLPSVSFWFAGIPIYSDDRERLERSALLIVYPCLSYT